MNNELLESLKRSVEKSIILLQTETVKNPHPMYDLILKRFRHAKELLNTSTPEMLSKENFHITGSARAFLETTSDYMDPVVIELDHAETLFEQVFK